MATCKRNYKLQKITRCIKIFSHFLSNLKPVNSRTSKLYLKYSCTVPWTLSLGQARPLTPPVYLRPCFQVQTTPSPTHPQWLISHLTDTLQDMVRNEQNFFYHQQFRHMCVMTALYTRPSLQIPV